MATLYIRYPSSSVFGGGSGGGGSGALAAGLVSLTGSQSVVQVTYSAAISSSRPPVISFSNIVDSSPIFIQGIVSSFSTTAFTVTMSAPADSVNYKMEYHVIGDV